MKIICDNCGARYSIADEKIRAKNKIYKIRCKKCEHVIVIRGSALEEKEDPLKSQVKADFSETESFDDAATKVYNYEQFKTDLAAGMHEDVREETLWYLVEGGQQAGPFSTEEVVRKYQAGQTAGKTGSSSRHIFPDRPPETGSSPILQARRAGS